MSAKKELAKTSKREKTLIENVVDLSKYVILTNNFKQRIRQTRALGSRLGCRLPTIDQLPVLDCEADNRIQELLLAIQTQLKVGYTEDKLIIPKGFSLSYEDLKNGYCVMEQIEVIRPQQGKVKHLTKRVVLFLSNNDHAFLEPIKAGELHRYDSVKDRLDSCSSVLKQNNILDILLENYEEEI